MRAALAVLALPALWLCAPAGADPGPGVPGVPALPFGGGPGIGTGPGIDSRQANLTPAAATIFLCPGVGGAANVLGFGGGYCDFDFQPVQLTPTSFGVMHMHCEWGGAAPLVEMWQCWRVFPGQPDHPAHPDPDI
ncbi:MAG TPA: hypothetical protein VGF36_08570, partial [Rhodopila sp.]